MPVTVLTLVNGICGAILAASGAITAYAGTLGGARWASVILGGIGVAQLVAAGILRVVDPVATAKMAASRGLSAKP